MIHATVRLAMPLMALWLLTVSPGWSQAGWSKSSQGLEARFSLEKGERSGKMRILHVYLEIRNVSDVANPIYVFYEPTQSLLVKMVDEHGKPVPVPGAAADVLSPSGHLLAIPWHGLLRFDVTAYGYAVAGDTSLLIGLHRGVWAVPRGRNVKWILSGTFSAMKPTAAVSERLWDGRLEIPGIVVDSARFTAP